MKLYSIIFSLSVLFLVTVQSKEWWEVASFYQIYPRSFMDSDGDGVGDLNGITEKLPYLQEIGIKATWLSPIFKSPMADFGYDISDFFSIQPEFGTMEDFDKLLARAKELGIKIILDFVPNHSSDQNEWFIKSVNREAGYEDFYVWHEGYPDSTSAHGRRPPSNWIQAFRGSQWEWNEQRQQYYLHQFTVQQPDLNYRNPIVVEAMKSVLRFWLEKGVDGFRIDAVPTLFEVEPDANGNYPDEPVSGLTDDIENPLYLKHIYTQDLDETIDMVYQWRAVLDEFTALHGGDSKVMLTEAYSPNISTVMRYYGDGLTKNGSNLPFNFLLMPNYGMKLDNAVDFQTTINLWLDNMPKGRTASWVIGNHDQRRFASRFGEKRIDALNTLVQVLPGASVTYYGDEIGMTDVYISWEDSVDPAACNSNPEIYEQFTRDPSRTPMQWDDSLNAGFSNGSTTWLPVSPKYKDVNVQVQRQAVNSHLNIYKKLLALRQLPALQNGETFLRVIEDDVLAILRHLGPGNPFYLTFVNLGITTKQNIDLRELKDIIPPELTGISPKFEIKIQSSAKFRQRMRTENISLRPNDFLVIKGN